jgi:hypothetical protein
MRLFLDKERPYLVLEKMKHFLNNKMWYYVHEKMWHSLK